MCQISFLNTLRNEKILADHFGRNGENSWKELEENFLLTHFSSIPPIEQEHASPSLASPAKITALIGGTAPPLPPWLR